MTDREKVCKLERKGAQTKKVKKGIAPPRYDEAFKAGAVRLVTEQGRQPRDAAKELGICIDTLRNWLKATGVQMGQACRVLEVSRSGYYGWLERKLGVRSQQNQALRRRLIKLHEKYPAMGLDSLYTC